MRSITLTAIAALAITGASGTAFSKAHLQPADTADFGQFTVANQLFDDMAQNLDARGADGEKGVSGQETSTDRKNSPHPNFETPATPMPDAPTGD